MPGSLSHRVSLEYVVSVFLINAELCAGENGLQVNFGIGPLFLEDLLSHQLELDRKWTNIFVWLTIRQTLALLQFCYKMILLRATNSMLFQSENVFLRIAFYVKESCPIFLWALYEGAYVFYVSPSDTFSYFWLEFQRVPTELSSGNLTKSIIGIRENLQNTDSSGKYYLLLFKTNLV